MNIVKYQQLSVEDWDSIKPEKPKSKPSQWDDLIETVMAGEIVAIPVNEKDVRGVRIGISRRMSSAYNAKAQFRYNADKGLLAIRLASEKPESDTPKKVGRPPRKA